MADDELLVRAAIRDELSGPLEEIREELRRTGNEAATAGGKAGRGARGFDAMGRGVKSLGRAGLKGIAIGIKGIAVAAGAAALAGAAFLKGAFSEAQDAAKVGRLTASAIKATGGAANVSAKQVADYAGALSSKTGIDDEAIQSGANMLLTFKNVRNEVGKGNKVFDQATSAAVDLSAAGFGSIKSASVLMGKALNDPVKGITALGRSGVTFSEDQKAMIGSLVETGDLLGAQKIILKEVQGQVGGAAESQATAADKMKVAWGNLQEEVGTRLMPVFDKAFTFISDKVIPIIDKFIRGIEDGTGAGGVFRNIMVAIYERGLKPVGQFISDTVVPAVKDLVTGFRDGTGIGGKFADFARGLGDTLRPIGVFIRDTLWPATKKFIGEMNSGEGAGGTFADIMTKVWAAAKTVADFVIRTLIPNLAKFVGFLIREGIPALFRIASSFLSMALFGVKAFRVLLQGALTGFGGILAAAEAGLGWIPGIGDKIKGARAAFDDFADSTVSKLKTVEDKLRIARDRADELGRPRTARIDVVTTYSTVGTPARIGSGRITLGDTASSRARGAGSLADTMAAHARYAGSGVRITNALIGGGGLGRGSGDHQAGRALDLQGPGLNSYAGKVRADGGYAAFHGAGSDRHLHAVPAAGDTAQRRAVSPSRRAAPATGGLTLEAGAVVVNVDRPATELDIEAAVIRALEAAERRRRERGA